MRAIAAFAIVLAHTYKNDPTTFFINNLVYIFSKFGVPFYCVAAGYFYVKGIDSGRQPRVQLLKSLKRLGFLYGIWSTVYFFNPSFSEIFNRGLLVETYIGRLQRLSDWETLLFVGPAFHLWFLSALIFTTITFALLDKILSLRNILIFSFGLYVFSNLIGSYASTPLGIDIGLRSRSFGFYTLLPFAIGVLLYRMSKKPSAKFGVVIIFIGILMTVFEIQWISEFPCEGFLKGSVMGTVLTGVGSFVIAVKNPPFLRSQCLAKIGVYSVGIYCGHMLFVFRLGSPFRAIPSPYGMFLLPVVSFTLAYILAVTISKISPLKRLVT